MRRKKMKIEKTIPREKFWKIVNASKKPIDEILNQVKITAEGIEDPKGIVFECLSIPTKDFVRGARKRHNAGKNKLYKQVLNEDSDPVRYNLMHQASMYAEKLNEEDRKKFEDEIEWRKATDDKVFAWIKQIFGAVR